MQRCDKLGIGFKSQYIATAGSQKQGVVADIGTHVDDEITRLNTSTHVTEHFQLIGHAFLGDFSLNIVRCRVRQTYFVGVACCLKCKNRVFVLSDVRHIFYFLDPLGPDAFGINEALRGSKHWLVSSEFLVVYQHHQHIGCLNGIFLHFKHNASRIK